MQWEYTRAAFQAGLSWVGSNSCSPSTRGASDMVPAAAGRSAQGGVAARASGGAAGSCVAALLLLTGGRYCMHLRLPWQDA